MGDVNKRNNQSKTEKKHTHSGRVEIVLFGTVVDEIKCDDATTWNMIQLNQFNYERRN